MNRAFFPVCIALLVTSASSGCDGGAEKRPRPELTAWIRPSTIAATGPVVSGAPALELVGSWNDWARPGRTDFRRVRDDDGVEWYHATQPLAPGTYQYAIVVGVQSFLDEHNPHSAFLKKPLSLGGTGGDGVLPRDTEFSEITIVDDATPLVEIERVAANGSSLEIDARFYASRAGAPLAPASVRVELTDERGARVDATIAVHDATRLTVTASALPPAAYRASITVADSDGREAAPVSARALVADGAPSDLADAIVYEIMVDRFAGGAGPLAPPATPGSRAGGTLDGVKRLLEAGYFESLGVTHLWLSPLYTNATGTFIGRDGRTYEPYHGYWPSAPRAVDPHLGDEAALEGLVARAHQRGLRVILDVVPNHVHEQHPYWPAHRTSVAGAESSWFHDADMCICGAPDCPWSSRILDCWFDAFLPDLDWTQPEVVAAQSADVVWWRQRFSLDGFRVDAVPMIPRAGTRRLVRAVRGEAAGTQIDHLMLGENYTGPGQAGRAELRTYLGVTLDGLDSEFDFPMMWALRDVIARSLGSFGDLDLAVEASRVAFAGSGGVIATMIDNHDTTRFISEAAGNAGADPWLAPPPQPMTDAPYQRALLALTYLFTHPGMPVLYYGDEVGLAGATDPDSRRVLPDVLAPATLLPQQAALLDHVRALGRLRRCAPALSRGVHTVLAIDADHEIYRVDPPDGAGGDVVLVTLSRGVTSAQLEVSGIPGGIWRDAFTGSTINMSGESIKVSMEPLGASVYVRAESRCSL